MAVFQRSSFFSFMFLCFPLLATICQTSHAAGSAMIQAINCSTSGNYTPSGAYADNLNQFLAALPESAVSKNGGFFNGTVGNGTATLYGLAMCSAGYSRADCGGCLADTAGSNTGGLPTRCPGSSTVLAIFDKCLVRYSNTNFLGIAETDVIYSSFTGESPASRLNYSIEVSERLQQLTGEAVSSPQRLASSMADPPYALAQCTWDLPPDKCKQCLDVLSTDATTTWVRMTTEGESKSYSCTIRYSNTSFTVVPFTDASSEPLPPPSSPVDRTSTSAPPPPPSSAKSSRTIAAATGSASAVSVVVLLGFCVWRRRSRSQHNTEGQRKYPTREFTYEQLKEATNNFAKEKELGQGAFGTVYEGRLPGIDTTVAIKQIIRTWSAQAKEDFHNEIRIMSKLYHRHVLCLLGWCDEDNHMLLVYEIMENGNLEERLYPRNNGPSVLSWGARRNILCGIASGLQYLHKDCPKAILHRDIKPANIMLDRDFNAKLADFGLVVQMSHIQTSHRTDAVIGTPFYIDPAYVESGRASGKSDVYSLGVMLLEIACGQKPSIMADDKNSLIEMVRSCRAGTGENSILEAADKGLRGMFDNEIKTVLELGLRCVQPDISRRPHAGLVRALLQPLVDEPSSVSVNGAAASSSHNRRPSEDGFRTCPETFDIQPHSDEEAGFLPRPT